MRRFAAAIHQRLFFKAFQRWREMAAEEKRVKFTLARSLMRLTQRLAFAAFNGWHVSARDARVARARLSRALTRLTQRRLYAAFAGWDDHARDRKRRTVLSRRFVARLSSRLQALAFDAWRDATSTRTRRRRISRQSIVKLSGRRLGRVPCLWAELIRHERAVRRNDMITRKIVAAYLVHRVAFSAFARWREFLYQIREPARAENVGGEAVSVRTLRRRRVAPTAVARVPAMGGDGGRAPAPAPQREECAGAGSRGADGARL